MSIKTSIKRNGFTLTPVTKLYLKNRKYFTAHADQATITLIFLLVGNRVITFLLYEEGTDIMFWAVENKGVGYSLMVWWMLYMQKILGQCFSNCGLAPLELSMAVRCTEGTHQYLLHFCTFTNPFNHPSPSADGAIRLIISN